MTYDQIEMFRNAIVRVVALAYLDGINAKPGATADDMLNTLADDTYRQMDGLMDLIKQCIDGVEKVKLN